LPAEVSQGICPACLLRSGTGAVEDATGFNRSSAGPVLETLAHAIGPLHRVVLPDTDPDDRGAAVIKPASDEMPVAAERGERYQLFGEIARGGMGAVLKGRDADLGRDLAVKVLLEEHQGKPELARRFVEEAQIGGQLQHPGIVPVYELGTFADRRPYFTMKLVKGRTLAALLSARHDPRDELPRFLGIFEQVAQTIAYAHARAVIHRDLKPSNVMVGSFGEVQVMDWGLAKVLQEGGVADEPQGESPTVPVSVIRTVRSGSADDDSQAGSVLGTPAYMAPEQAGGEVAAVDRRADVFGLGSILCEILTGKPAYTGANNNEIFRRALRGDTGDARTRLDACGADTDLVALASDCLAPEPAGRPRDAGVVAGRITAYLAGVQEKLRTAERQRAVAQARAVEEQRRRKLQLGLAATLLALTTIGGLSTSYYIQQKQARAAVVARTLGEAATLRGQALAHADDPALWQAALAAVRRVEDALGSGGGDARGQLAVLRAEVQAGLDAAERDRRLLDRLAGIRSAKGDDLEGTVSDADYADTFKEAGIDVAALPPAETGKRIAARPSATALALAAALDDWADVRRRKRSDLAGAKRLSEAAQVADPDPWRGKLRAALGQTDTPARLTALQAAYQSARIDALGPVTLNLLARGLDSSGDAAAAETVLRAAQKRHPGDLWINNGLAGVCENRNRRDDAIRFYTAARAIRPQTGHPLAHLLEQKGALDEAIALFKELDRLDPHDGGHLTCLGTLLREHGRAKEAEPFLEAGVVAARAALRLRPESAAAHSTLGWALDHQGKLDQAIAAYRAAIRIKPDDIGARVNLGNALRKQGKLDEAIAAYREAIRIKPDDARTHNNLGLALRDQGKRDLAIAEFHEAIRLNPDHALAHKNLGHTLRLEGKPDEAIAEYRAALRLNPDDASAHNHLGAILCDLKHDYDEAIAEFRAALRLNPDDPDAHFNLGNALRGQGKVVEAVTAFRAALRLDPDDASAHNNLGAVLCDSMHDYDAAVAEFRAAIRLQPGIAVAHVGLGNSLRGQGKVAEAVAEYRAAILIKPDYALAHKHLVNALRDQGNLDLVIDEYRAMIRLKPDNAEAHSNLGAALSEQGKHDQAIDAFRAAIRLQPGLADARAGLGHSLRVQGKLDEAIEEFRAAIRLQPDHATAHNNLGRALRAQGKLDEAIAAFRGAIRIAGDYTVARDNLGLALRAQGKRDEAMAEFSTAIRNKPGDGRALGILVSDLIREGAPGDAEVVCRDAIRVKPDLAEAHSNLGTALRAQGKLEDALVALRRASELAQPGSPLARMLPGVIRKAEQGIALHARLLAVLKGEARPRNDAERAALVQLCKDQGRYAAAARLLGDALAADPTLGDDRRNSLRYNAACYAALAGCGQSRDDPPLDERARAALRRQALDWLKGERAAWASHLESGAPQARATVIKTLKRWQQDADLTGVREDESLARLPDEERKAWRDLWSDVDGLLKKAEADCR
jgi:serine/threonine-protein kinase